MARFGSFAGGLASGIAGGYRLGMEADEAEQRRKTGDLQREALGLEVAQGKRAADWQTARQKLITDMTTEPMLSEDAAGNYVEGGRRRRQLSQADTLNLYERLGEIDMAHGKLDPAHALDLKNRIAAFEREGVFDAYRAFKQSGNPEDAVRMFNTRGSVKLDPQAGIHESEARDNVTGMPYKKYLARTVDGKVLTFDPLEAARLAGGAKGILDELRQGFEARKVAATEARERAREVREENRYLAGERRADQRDRQLDIMAARQNRGDKDKPLTTAQKMKNMSIDAARKFVSGLSQEEIRRRTAKATNTGRENPDYDPLLSKRVSLANSRKYGDDPDFDESSASQPQAIPKEPSVENRFHADPAMKGRKLGRKTDRGMEVLDASGKLIGHYN